MKKLSALTFAALCLLFYKTSSAQEKDDKEEKDNSYFKVGLSYLSDNVYLGRKDSVAIPYLTPSLGYYHKSGLFITASGSYLSTESRMDAVTIEAGYSFSKNKLDGEFSVGKDFYSNQSYSVKSEMQGDASAFLGYDLGFIKPSVTGTLSFGTTTDYAATLGVEHAFTTSDEKLDITPS